MLPMHEKELFQVWLIHWNGIHKKTPFLHALEQLFRSTLSEVPQSDHD